METRATTQREIETIRRLQKYDASIFALMLVTVRKNYIDASLFNKLIQSSASSKIYFFFFFLHPINLVHYLNVNKC